MSNGALQWNYKIANQKDTIYKVYLNIMDTIYPFLDSNSEESEDEIHQLALARRRLRDKCCILEMPNNAFVKEFRLTKGAFLEVLSKIEPDFKKNRRSTGIPPLIKLATTLRFLAQGSYQDSVGQEYLFPLSQTSVCRVIEETTTLIENRLCPEKIRLEMSEEEKKQSKEFFYKKSGIPGVIGAVDGTHLRIIRPTHQEHLYFNRKGYHSLNVMVICDFNLKIRSVRATHGGASHDAAIWGTSDERFFLKEHFYKDKSWILGDSGYPLEAWLLTPYRMTEEDSPEAFFNQQHAKARNVIERLFGILKGRFRCLLSARELHYSPRKCAKFFNVCSALHNVCNEHNIELEYNLVSSSENFHEVYNSANVRSEATNIRDSIKNTLFLHRIH